MRLNDQITDQQGVNTFSTYLIVIKIDIVNDTTDLFFNPDLSAVESGTADYSLSNTVDACERVWLHGSDSMNVDWQAVQLQYILMK